MSDDTINVTGTYDGLDESMKLCPVQNFLVDLSSDSKDINYVGDDFSIEHRWFRSGIIWKQPKCVFRDPQYKYAVQYKIKQAKLCFRRTTDESDEEFSNVLLKEDDEESEPEG